MKKISFVFFLRWKYQLVIAGIYLCIACKTVVIFFFSFQLFFTVQEHMLTPAASPSFLKSLGIKSDGHCATGLTPVKLMLTHTQTLLIIFAHDKCLLLFRIILWSIQMSFFMATSSSTVEFKNVQLISFKIESFAFQMLQNWNIWFIASHCVVQSIKGWHLAESAQAVKFLPVIIGFSDWYLS